jgi:hypothetical protein
MIAFSVSHPYLPNRQIERSLATLMGQFSYSEDFHGSVKRSFRCLVARYRRDAGRSKVAISVPRIPRWLKGERLFGRHQAKEALSDSSPGRCVLFGG